METFPFGFVLGAATLWAQYSKKKLHPAIEDVLVNYSRWAYEPRNNKEHCANKLGYDDYMEYLRIENWDGFCGSGCPFTVENPGKGETVVDFGSGLGGDSIIAAKLVGPTGRVFGLDVTPDMVLKATQAAESEGVKNVSFLEDQIDDTLVNKSVQNVDRVISNGVINLCINKQKMFQNAFDLLKSGGRMVYSDVVKLKSS